MNVVLLWKVIRYNLNKQNYTFIKPPAGIVLLIVRNMNTFMYLSQ